MTLKYKTNINCGNCIKSVTPFLNLLDNVDSWKVDTDNPDKILKIEIDDEDVAIVEEALINSGFRFERV